MVTPALSTFSTQRYDHRLKHQLSSISGFFTTDSTMDSSTPPSTITLEASSVIAQERVMDCLSHPRPLSSRSSSNPTSSRWHEGHSRPVSRLTQIDSSDVLSSNTSLTSFHLSTGGWEQSSLMAKKREGEQLLFETSLSTSQVEAHVPAVSTKALSEGMGVGGEGGEIQEQVRLVPTLSTQVDAFYNPTPTVRARPRTRNINALPSPLCLHQYCHPEYDSDDIYSWSDPSTSNLSSFSAASEVENGGRDTLVGDAASIHTFGNPLTLNNNVTSLSLVIPPPLSPFMRLRGSNSGAALATDLADIGEEGLVVGETASQRTSHVAGLGLDSDDLAPQVTSGASPTESKAWWKFYPKDRRATWASSCFEQTGRHELGESVTAARLSSGGAPDSGSRESRPPVLPRSRSLSPVRATRQSSGARKILSVVLPCIPPLCGGNEFLEKTNNNPGPNTDSWTKLIPTFSFGPWRKKNRQAHKQEENEKGCTVTEQASGVHLGVRVDQQVSRVVDH